MASLQKSIEEVTKPVDLRASEAPESIKEIPKVNIPTGRRRPEMSEAMKEARAKDRKMVRGKFIFHEVPGGRMQFPFRAYEGDPINMYDMTDGQILTIPLGVYKHLNTNCWYPSYTYKNDEAGRPTMSVGQKIRRCSFQSMEFLDEPIGSAIPL